MSTFWRDRSVLVTGATGLVGGWLTGRLLDAGADVACLVRDWVPRSRLFTSGLADRVTVVRGDLCDQGAMERILGEHEVATVFHLAAQTIVGSPTATPSRPSRRTFAAPGRRSRPAGALQQSNR